MSQGKIGVTTENIFPVIKQFLYSDHEIFLRELVANAVDASSKLKALAANGTVQEEIGDLKVQVILNENEGTLKIVDNGIGMSEEEVDKYINQIAFSSAGEFLEKYKDQLSNIIGHFGLGFYSAFMVADKVTIETKSYKADAPAVIWSCDGSPEYTLEPCEKADRGTVITLYLSEEAKKEYGNKGRIGALLGKYCKFMPVPVVFGKQTEWKDGKEVEKEEDNVINSVEPLWTKAPSDLKDEDYNAFYETLYPMAEEPLFYIHLHVDYPFNLTGILYFPKIKDRLDVTKNRIQLYCNQVFVTDNVEAIVPDFLTLLHGVIDSPDIPLNVSRSYLQSDANVKKISTYITKKVADRLESIFKNERAALEEKWDNLKLFIEYGMLSDEKFCERAMKFALLKDSEGKFYAIDDYLAAVKDNQTDKDGSTICLYATDIDAQYSFIEGAKAKGYNVLHLDCQLDSHFVNLLEQKCEKTRFVRVDSDHVDNLIVKEEKAKLEVAKEVHEALDKALKAVLPTDYNYYIQEENLGAQADAVILTQNEFMRRYREMSALGGGMNFYGSMPESYNVILNMENPVVAGLAEQVRGAENVEEIAKADTKLCQLIDLALLGSGLLKGKALAEFIQRSKDLL